MKRVTGGDEINDEVGVDEGTCVGLEPRVEHGPRNANGENIGGHE